MQLAAEATVTEEPLVDHRSPILVHTIGCQQLRLQQDLGMRAHGMEGAQDTCTESGSITGAVCWDASVAMAHLLEEKAELVRGLRCVELGSGMGLQGMAAALAGAQEVKLVGICSLPANLGVE